MIAGQAARYRARRRSSHVADGPKCIADYIEGYDPQTECGLVWEQQCHFPFAWSDQLVAETLSQGLPHPSFRRADRHYFIRHATLSLRVYPWGWYTRFGYTA